MSNWDELRRQARLGRKILAAALLIAALGLCVGLAQDKPAEPKPQPEQPAKTLVARGVVFDDKNGNGTRDKDEPGLPGVRVSNQHQVTVTDQQGTWELPHDDDTTFFVVKPRGWRTPQDADNLPRFFYHHRPKGSPALRFSGIAPTGDLPASIDFPLVKAIEPDKFDVVFFADPQAYNLQQVDWVANDAVQELIGTKAAFGVTLGDIVGDDLNLFAPTNAAIGLIGRPWFNVIGNHDINYDAPDDVDSDETFRRVYGPNYYSFDYGAVHFVALDNVRWTGRNYYGELSQDQLAWLAEDLKHVPPEQLTVLMMHIPIYSRLPGAPNNTADRLELYKLIEDRRVLAMAGHMHTHTHSFLDERHGWKGEQAFEHVDCVTVSGSWWRGEPDDRGIPHATMRDGAPNGYVIATFDGNKHSMRFKAAGRPDDYQMLIQAPDAVWSDRAAGVPVYANVFGGSERSVVEWRLGGEWQKMEWSLEVDPRYAEMQRTQELPAPMGSEHLWKSALPEDLKPGTHAIEVRTTDVYGQKFEARRVLRVMDASLRPEIESFEPAVLVPGARLVVKCAKLTGRDVQLMVPTGDYQWTPLKVQIRGNTLEAALPDNLCGGSLCVRCDLLWSDAALFELGSKSPHGLRGEYFELDSPGRTIPNFDALTPRLIRRDANVNFADAAAFELPFEVNFGVRWSGQIEIKQAGEYEFSLAADDRSEFTIAGQQVEQTGKLKLEPGSHTVKLLYLQRRGPASVQLKWRPPGETEFVPVPAEVLKP